LRTGCQKTPNCFVRLFRFARGRRHATLL
jgi:hypothetical protein